MNTEVKKIKIDEITKKVCETLEYFQPIELNQNLVDLGLDSLASVNLLVDLEEIYNIEFDDEELLIENFSTIEKIFNLVSKKL